MAAFVSVKYIETKTAYCMWKGAELKSGTTSDEEEREQLTYRICRPLWLKLDLPFPLLSSLRPL